MAWSWTNWTAVAVVAALSACAGEPSAAELDPDGPPMIAQVRLSETFSLDGVTSDVRSVFAFGTHPAASDADAHAVTAARASGNALRVVIDELLRGDPLEEIACRYPVDDDAFARVPAGVTPDDVFRCTAAQGELAQRCPGSSPLSLCLCRIDGGCPSGSGQDGAPSVTPSGESVGVLDRDQDGAADATRFVDGAAAIRCGELDVPIDLDASSWMPSGNQQKPAQGGFDALGPALVIVPAAALPTGRVCGVAFAPSVVDHDGHAICAPLDGELARGCAPGDTSAIAFTVEPLRFTLGVVITDPGQSRTAPIKIRANAPLDRASLAAITVTDATGARYPSFAVALSAADEIAITWTAVGGLAPATRYTIVVPANVTDVYHQPARQPITIAFTTGAI